MLIIDENIDAMKKVLQALLITIMFSFAGVGVNYVVASVSSDTVEVVKEGDKEGDKKKRKSKKSDKCCKGEKAAKCSSEESAAKCSKATKACCKKGAPKS